MTIDKINAVLEEMRRMKQRAEALKKALKEADAFESRRTSSSIASCPRESGALRRASMDLTRALADMRRVEG